MKGSHHFNLFFSFIALKSQKRGGSSFPPLMGFGNRGIVADKWSGRLLWVCAIGSAVGFYMVAVERQTQNRAKMMAQALADAGSSIDSSDKN
ncbi:hypothetical protein K7X08_020592 [Anisodus acutangulus]|uniref:Uncharacterized protein n=2 Tax=Anisodus TaxID=243963 RepID=A0A9Q1RQD3_9SOLA|nr:hypothetical protein K7X08_020592 [Anisodus acutangulus]